MSLGGGYYEIVAVPEPSTYLGGALATAALSYHYVIHRRRRRADREPA